MQLTRTIKIKLAIPAKVIHPTITAYTKAFNHVCEIGWNDSDSNGVSLHHKTYSETRKYLPSQLAISARIKATEVLKAVKVMLRKKPKATCPKSKRASIRFDARSYNVWFDRNELSLLTINGRIKLPIFVPGYFKQYLAWKRCSADLFLRKDKVFLHIVFQKDIEDSKQPDNPIILGIDRGINKVAVCSDNTFFNGNINKIAHKYQRLRRQFQKCGSKSAKRHLKKISLKENRFRKDVNHCISKQVVESLSENSIIVLEDLKKIRQRAKLNKKGRRKLHSWSFYQLEQFITYKANAERIKVDYVDARYTSQKCSKCGHISRSNRKSQAVFKCVQCDFSLNADLNASRNIEANYRDAKGYPEGLSVNQPIVAHVDAKGPFGQLRRSAATNRLF